MVDFSWKSQLQLKCTYNHNHMFPLVEYKFYENVNMYITGSSQIMFSLWKQKCLSGKKLILSLLNRKHRLNSKSISSFPF